MTLETTTYEESVELLGATKAAELKAFDEGFQMAHDPAKCGHARANYKDPAWGTPEYAGNEQCEACAAVQAERTRCAGIARQTATDYNAGAAAIADAIEHP